MTQSSLLRTISRCSWRSSTRHSNGCSSSHSAGGNGNHGLRCFGDGSTLQRLRHMPRRPVRATRLPVVHGTQTVTKASEDGISMTCIIEIASYDLQLLGTCSGRFSSPRREYTTCSNQMIDIEHSRRLRGTGLRPEDSPGGHYVSYVLGTARRKLSAGVPNGVRMSGRVEWESVRTLCPS